MAVTTSLSRAVAVGARPRTSALALLAALGIAVLAAVLRLLDPTALLGLEPSLATAALGGCLAGLVGRYRGGVLAAVLAAAIPVFVVDAATTAVNEPITLGLVARAAAGAAWYTTGVAVLLVGPLGYALGTLSQPGPDRHRPALRSHLPLAPSQTTPLVAWVALALAATAVATLAPTTLPRSPTALSPLPVAAGLAIAADLGRRAPRALAATLAGWVGVTTGLHLFTRNFVVAGPAPTDPPSLSALALVTTLGLVAGLPLGLVGYTIGRTLDD